uniref:Uncharacterized protein n=1 Tax=Timema poppense TaxID=170557 RepID=A0A7R9GUB7_TIMPO|nr:unnamed protein product [Timema poppensis]
MTTKIDISKRVTEAISQRSWNYRRGDGGGGDTSSRLIGGKINYIGDTGELAPAYFGGGERRREVGEEHVAHPQTMGIVKRRGRQGRPIRPGPGRRNAKVRPRKCTRICAKEKLKLFRENHPWCTRPELNPDLPVSGSLVQHESSAFTTWTPEPELTQKLHGLSPQTSYTDRAAATVNNDGANFCGYRVSCGQHNETSMSMDTQHECWAIKLVLLKYIVNTERCGDIHVYVQGFEVVGV